jgi:hypothetical protein
MPNLNILPDLSTSSNVVSYLIVFILLESIKINRSIIVTIIIVLITCSILIVIHFLSIPNPFFHPSLIFLYIRFRLILIAAIKDAMAMHSPLYLLGYGPATFAEILGPFACPVNHQVT